VEPTAAKTTSRPSGDHVEIQGLPNFHLLSMAIASAFTAALLDAPMATRDEEVRQEPALPSVHA